MMFSYTYEFADFPVGEVLDPGRLAERVADTSLPPLTIEYDDDGEEVCYLSTTELTGPQQATLDAHVAGYVHETLAEAKTRCVALASAYRRKLMLTPELGGKVVEYPPGEGKLWSLGVESLQEWHALYRRRASLAYPYTVNTHDGTGSHTFADQAALEAVCGQIYAMVLADNEARDAAVSSIMAAASIEDAEAALSAYAG
jgi:hypothetical protein